MYEFKSGSHIKADANVAGAMCKELENSIGLTPKNLLDANRDEKAPLHNCFDWNDGEAAEKWREQQARHIINCLCVKTETTEKTPVRAFFNIDKVVYESTDVILRQENKRAMLLEQALREARIFETKYQTLSELQPVFNEIDKLTA